MPKDKKPLPPLTEQQKEYIRLHWNMDLRQLAQNVFSNPNLTLRHVESKAVAAYIIELGHGGPNTPVVPIEAILTDEQKEYVRNTHESSSPLKMARTLFGNPTLTLVSQEARAVLAHCKEIAPSRFDRANEPVDEMEYKAPRNLTEMVARVNRLVPNPAGLADSLYDRAKLTIQQEKALNVLLAAVNYTRFVHQASQYLKKVDRELFESAFLRQIHDREDLSSSDIDQYISYCASIVSGAQTERTIQRLQAQADEEFESNGKVSMTLVEHLKQLNTALQDEKKRQESLYKTLDGSRAERLDSLTAASNSMHPLVEAWRNKEKRNRLILAAGTKRDAAKKEIRRLTEAESLACEVWGPNPDTIYL